MIVKHEGAARNRVAVLFGRSQGPLIASALQGFMGSLWAEDAAEPACALICNGDVAFFAGESRAKEAKTLLERFAQAYAGRSMVVPAEERGWAELIRERFGGEARAVERYAMRLPAEGFDHAMLWEYVRRIKPPYSLAPIGAREYADALKESWSRDFCSQFADFQQYARTGLGFVTILDGVAVSGASSYVTCREGIEIQVDTREDHRLKGLAAACSARLILECSRRGLSPHWDAANPASVALAKALGYCLERAYPALEVDVPEAAWQPQKNCQNPDTLAGNKEGRAE